MVDVLLEWFVFVQLRKIKCELSDADDTLSDAGELTASGFRVLFNAKGVQTGGVWRSLVATDTDSVSGWNGSVKLLSFR